MEIERYWGVIWKWLWLIIIGIGVAAATSYFISQSMEPVYQATATLVVKETTNPVSSFAYSQSAVTTHAELIKKQSMMEEVIHKLNIPYSSKKIGGED